MSSSTTLARLVVDELVRHRVRHAVVAPGSRSAPLALALHAADAGGLLQLHVRVDERVACFLALGLSRGGRAPVPVVTTSGTAVAQLHPAVLEAHHSGVPLIVLSADRPAALRATGANQTTDQARIFGAAVRLHADVPADGSAPMEAWRALVSRAVAASTGALSADPGPVHLNLCFPEPLLPSGADVDPPPGRPGNDEWTRVTSRRAAPPFVLPSGRRTVVVAGADAGPDARVLAERAGWPLLAEPTSGSRTGRNVMRSARLLLDHEPLVSRVEQVVVCGRPTVSRPVTRLLSRPGVHVVVVAERLPWTDPGHRANLVVPAVTPPAAAADGWLEQWRALDEAVSERVDGVLDDARSALRAGVLLGHDVARTVTESLPAGGLLVVGSSQPVRDLDLVAAVAPVGGRRLVFANRGLAGIDGTVSTSIGAALARTSSRALAYVGDLTFLHDAGALLMGPAEPRPDLTIVVANDDGGSIFSVLEQGGPDHGLAFERVFATPTHADLAALCDAYGVPHGRVEDRAALGVALGRPTGGVEVVEAAVDRGGRRALEAQLETAARRTLGDLLPA